MLLFYICEGITCINFLVYDLLGIFLLMKKEMAILRFTDSDVGKIHLFFFTTKMRYALFGSTNVTCFFKH
jgi:hypothetical protein